MIEGFPREVQKDILFALVAATAGETVEYAEPLKGFHGAKVFAIKVRDNGNTYRAVYTVEFEDAIWVLHAFQKKSKTGIGTPEHEMKLVEQRLKELRRTADG